jgi:hypothetical protein
VVYREVLSEGTGEGKRIKAEGFEIKVFSEGWRFGEGHGLRDGLTG